MRRRIFGFAAAALLCLGAVEGLAFNRYSGKMAMSGSCQTRHDPTGSTATFGWFTADFNINICGGVASVSPDIITRALQKYAGTFNTNVLYVSPSGVDADAGPTSTTTILNATSATVASGTGILVGQAVVCTSRFPVGTTVAAIAGTALTTSQGAVAAGASNCTFSNGTQIAPLKTLTQALRSPATQYPGSWASTVHLACGYYAPGGYRRTDANAGSGVFKLLVGDCPKGADGAPGAIIGTVGTDISSGWTLVSAGTYSKVVNAFPERVIDSSQFQLDGHYLPYLQYGSLALLQASGSNVGWAYDSTIATIYVQQAGAVVTGANLRAIYDGTVTTASPAQNMLIYGASLGIVNVTLEDTYVAPTYDTVARAEVWIKDSTIRYASAQGLLCQGANCYSQNVTAYNNKQDNFSLKANGSTVKGLEVNNTSTYSGDPFNYGTSFCGAICNGSSADEGDVVRVGGTYKYNEGPNLTDHFNAWNIGPQFGSSIGATTNGFGYSSQVAGSLIFCESCKGLGGESATTFNNVAGGTMNLFQPVAPNGTSGVIGTYAPN